MERPRGIILLATNIQHAVSYLSMPVSIFGVCHLPSIDAFWASYAVPCWSNSPDLEASIDAHRFQLLDDLSLKNKTAQKGGGERAVSVGTGGERRVEDGGVKEEDLTGCDGGGGNEDTAATGYVWHCSYGPVHGGAWEDEDIAGYKLLEVTTESKD